MEKFVVSPCIEFALHTPPSREGGKVVLSGTIVPNIRETFFFSAV
jgi:hypothetical protein